jgi:hypothetical protein
MGSAAVPGSGSGKVWLSRSKSPAVDSLKALHVELLHHAQVQRETCISYVQVQVRPWRDAQDPTEPLRQSPSGSLTPANDNAELHVQPQGTFEQPHYHSL